MWQQYRNTFLRVQVLVCAVTFVAYAQLGHQWQQAAACFVVMQIAGLLGAAWAVRLQGLMRKRVERTPLWQRA
jgi:hypothetical protein